MKKFIAWLPGLIILVLLTPTRSMAQDSHSLKTYRVGIFAPIYLDSVAKGGIYQYGKSFPRFTVPGLDFMQGAMVALDSMPLYNARIDARLYDSKSKTETLDSLESRLELDSLDLIIGAVKDEEYLQLAGIAKKKHIPFISATYPNDGGITGNPFLVILNSTLKAHCESIYDFLSREHVKDNIILVKQSGVQEDKVAGYFNQLHDADWGGSVKFKTFHTDSNFHALKTILDSNRTNVIIGASLDETFAANLAITASSLHAKYKTKLIGMPNWETFASFVNPKKAVVSDFPVYVTSPYFNYKIDSFSKLLQDVYLKKYKGKPSDYAYKGFETVFVFCKLLTMYSDDMLNHLNEYPYKIFTEYRFKPVLQGKQNGNPDYIENKHLYWIKILNAVPARAW